MRHARAARTCLALAIVASATCFGGVRASPPDPNLATAAGTFVLQGLDGRPHQLGDWSGKVIVLHFWASWCASCQVEIRDFVSYQEKHAAQGLQIVGIGLDEVRPLRNVLRSLEINYPVLVADPIRDVGILRDWGDSSGAIPYTVVIDRAGHIVHRHRGPMAAEQLDEILTPFLEGN